jgi:SAM-dependent methyltransferase
MSEDQRWRAYWQGQVVPRHRSDTDDFYRQHAGELKLLFAHRQASSVLEIGCGNGALYPYLGFDQMEYKGIDFSRSMLEQFAVADPSVSLQQAEGSSYRDSCQYDLIFASSIVQYFDPRMLRTHVANIRTMMHSDSVYVCACIPWRSRRIGFMSGRLVPPYRASAVRFSKTILRTLATRTDTLGHWYDTNDIATIAEANNMSVTFYGSMTYLYRFHAVMQPRQR